MRLLASKGKRRVENPYSLFRPQLCFLLDRIGKQKHLSWTRQKKTVKGFSRIHFGSTDSSRNEKCFRESCFGGGSSRNRRDRERRKRFLSVFRVTIKHWHFSLKNTCLTISCPPILSLSLSLTHTHTHTHTHICYLIRSHAASLTPLHVHSLYLSPTNSLTFIHTHSHSLFHTYSLSLSFTLTHAHSFTLSHTHTHTCSVTHALSLTLTLFL